MKDIVTMAQMETVLKKCLEAAGFTDEQAGIIGALPVQSTEDGGVDNSTQVDMWTEFTELARQRLNRLVEVAVANNIEQLMLEHLAKAAGQIRRKSKYHDVYVRAQAYFGHSSEELKGEFVVEHCGQRVSSGISVYDALVEVNRRNGFDEYATPRNLTTLAAPEPKHDVVEAAPVPSVEEDEPTRKPGNTKELDDEIPF